MPVDKEKWKNRNPRVQHSMWLFEWEHLDPQLQPVSRILCEAAAQVVAMVPDNEQTEIALFFLLAAKDGFVRAAIGGALPPSIDPRGMP